MKNVKQFVCGRGFAGRRHCYEHIVKLWSLSEIRTWIEKLKSGLSEVLSLRQMCPSKSFLSYSKCRIYSEKMCQANDLRNSIESAESFVPSDKRHRARHHNDKIVLFGFKNCAAKLCNPPKRIETSRRITWIYVYEKTIFRWQWVFSYCILCLVRHIKRTASSARRVKMFVVFMECKSVPLLWSVV